MEYLENLIKLKKHYKKNESRYNKKINELYNYCNNNYEILNEILEERVGQNGIIEKSKYYQEILMEILSIIKHDADIEESLIHSLNKEDGELTNKFILIIYNYLIDKINFSNIKLSLYLECMNINFENFYNLSEEATLCLCELKLRSIDVEEISGFGNYKIQFALNVAKGKYKNMTNRANALNDIYEAVDIVMETGEMRLITYDKATLYFSNSFINDHCEVHIFLNDNYIEPILILRDDNVFLKGSEEDLIEIWTVGSGGFEKDTQSELDKLIKMKKEEIYTENRNDNILLANELKRVNKKNKK